jgi:hypothetical protein
MIVSGNYIAASALWNCTLVKYTSIKCNVYKYQNRGQWQIFENCALEIAQKWHLIGLV